MRRSEKNVLVCYTGATSDMKRSTGQTLTRQDRMSFLDAPSSSHQPPREGSQPATVLSVSVSSSPFSLEEYDHQHIYSSDISGINKQLHAY